MTQPLRLHRNTIRLPEYDYTSAGAYFITICTHGHICMFGEMSTGKVTLSTAGNIAQEEWLRTPEIRPEIILDEFVIMPNHLHGIIFITENVGADGRPPLQEPCPHLNPPNKSFCRPPKSLGSFVAGFKSTVTKRINILRSTPGAPVWQRNYYEHIIRDDDDLSRIRDYIRNNPLQWATDPECRTP